jgi:hypothetical protein
VSVGKRTLGRLLVRAAQQRAVTVVVYVCRASPVISLGYACTVANDARRPAPGARRRSCRCPRTGMDVAPALTWWCSRPTSRQCSPSPCYART